MTLEWHLSITISCNIIIRQKINGKNVNISKPTIYRSWFYDDVRHQHYHVHQDAYGVYLQHENPFSVYKNKNCIKIYYVQKNIAKILCACYNNVYHKVLQNFLSNNIKNYKIFTPKTEVQIFFYKIMKIQWVSQPGGCYNGKTTAFLLKYFVKRSFSEVNLHLQAADFILHRQYEEKFQVSS